MREPAKARLAASVILLRRAERKGFEVFLTRRHEGMEFLGGMYCFPGGTVRKEDCSAAMLRRCRGLAAGDARNIIGAHFAPQQALGLWVAGIRELFEEAGILLAVEETGKKSRQAKQNHPARLAERHAALLDKSLSFKSLLESEALLCDASSLAYFSHWQTPSRLALRFDTRFFLAALPQDQTPLPSSPEVTHSLWLTPDSALQLFAKDELPMIFPTFASLRTLADFESLESAMREFRRS